jgi:hypothetical protein
MAKKELMLEIKCAGDNCRRMVEVRADAGLSLDMFKFSCDACGLQTKTQKESKKSSHVRKMVDGQVKLIDEQPEESD